MHRQGNESFFIIIYTKRFFPAIFSKLLIIFALVMVGKVSKGWMSLKGANFLITFFNKWKLFSWIPFSSSQTLHLMENWSYYSARPSNQMKSEKKCERALATFRRGEEDNKLIAKRSKSINELSLFRFIGINFYLKLIKFIPLTEYSNFSALFCSKAFFLYSLRRNYFLNGIWWKWCKIDGFFRRRLPLEPSRISSWIFNSIFSSFVFRLPVDTFYIDTFVRFRCLGLSTFW